MSSVVGLVFYVHLVSYLVQPPGNRYSNGREHVFQGLLCSSFFGLFVFGEKVRIQDFKIGSKVLRSLRAHRLRPYFFRITTGL